MKILVTGGAGFIGSAVIRLAIARGHSVINIDALTYAACLDNVANVASNSNYAFEQIDIREKLDLECVLAKHNPDVIMHLAAESHVDRSIDRPADFINTNILGTFNLLEAARHHWQKCGRPDNFRFHHVSTDEVFGSLGPTGMFSEDSPYDPRSPYSASKASSDHLTRSWYETYGLPILLTNCSNNYGPYQFPEKLIPLVIHNALTQKALPIYGDGLQKRDWLYVSDHCSAIHAILNRGVCGEVYNIGGLNEKANIEIVHALCDILDELLPIDRSSHISSYRDLITYVKDRPGHDRRYAIDATKIEKELNWRPAETFETGIRKTVEWYLDNDDWVKQVTNGEYRQWIKRQYA